MEEKGKKISRFKEFLSTKMGKWFIFGLSLILLSSLLLSGRGGEGEYFLAEAQRMDVVSSIEVTGRVKPTESVNLALQRGGRVASLRASVGDRVASGEVLLSVDNADLMASLSEARALLEIERLRLERTGRTSVTELENVKSSLVNSIEDAFVKVDDAIRSRTDNLFTGTFPYQTFGVQFDFGGPTIVFGASTRERSDFRNQRREIEGILSRMAEIDRDDILRSAEKTERDLIFIRGFLTSIAGTINSYEEYYEHSSAMNLLRSDISFTRTVVNTAISNLQSTRQAYQTTLASLQGSVEDPQDVLIQQEQLKIAQARVDSITAEINKTIIRAPFAGLVTRVSPSIGEVVSANTPLIGLLSDAEFEVEVFIPEVDSIAIAPGNEAKITLDPYGSGEVFKATVVFVDPAETTFEGVSTYRALLQFDETDARIRSGMTANVEIITGVSEGALVVPQRAVIERAGEFVVRRITVGEEFEEVRVQTGLRDLFGNIEILSGLDEGDKVITFQR